MPKLYLVDGNNHLFRAFYAIRNLSTSDGMPVNAVFGFANMLLKMVRDEKPDYVAVVFDHSEISFRNERFPDYKGHRPDMPEALVPQLPLVRELVRGFNIACLEEEGLEADDIIGTLAVQARAADPELEVRIVSMDKDLMQLVDERTQMIDTMKDVRYGPAEVEEKLGVKPSQVIDFLALMGDSSDNIPGVPGIGKKTAAKLLGDYESLDGIYAAIDEQKGKRKQNLIEHKEAAYLSQWLATVKTDAKLGVTLEDLRLTEPDRPALTNFFWRMQFKTLHREFHDEGAASESLGLSRDGFEVVADAEGLEAVCAMLMSRSHFALHSVTDSGDHVSGELVGVAVAIDKDKAWYVPVAQNLLDAGEHPSLADLKAHLGPLLEDRSITKSAGNVKAEYATFSRLGIALEGVRFDPELASYLMDPDRLRTHSTPAIALALLNHKTLVRDELTNKGKTSFERVPIANARDYACDMAQATIAIEETLAEDIDEWGLDGLMDDLEIPLSKVLADMELAGVLVDKPLLATMSEEFGERAAAIEKEAHTLVGEEFALGSPKQLQVILFDKLGLSTGKKTKTGYSTASDVLEEIKSEHALPGLILDWRSLTKLKSTYTDALPELVNPKTGRIHTTFQQTVAATGRLSSADPNLQNIPIRTAEGRRIREAFVAPEGAKLLAADYSQIELRILAHLCGSERMVEAFKEGADIHRRTARELFGAAEDGAVTREQRAMAKTINFGILYGMSAFRLAREQGISRTEAQEIIDRYFGRYPKILQWKEDTLAQAKKTGQVSTITGRLRRLPDLHSRNWQARSHSERVAINTPVQGSAADIIKQAMIVIHRKLATSETLRDVRMVLQVHDELVFEVPDDLVGPATELVTSEMEGVMSLDVPLVANAATGRTWLEAH